MAGIAVCHWTTLPLHLWILLTATAAIASGSLLYFNKGKHPTSTAIALAITVFAIGVLRCLPDDPHHDTSHWSHSSAMSPKHPSYLTLRLNETPIPRERSYRATAKLECIGNQKTNGNLCLYLRCDSTAALRYGDRLLAHGYVDREKGSLYLTSAHYLLTGRDSTSLRARCEGVRMKLLQRMQEGPLEPRYRGIAEALTLGWRGDLEPNLQTQFRDAGIMHLLCVSGLHVGLLATIVGWLLFFVGKERRGRIIRGSIQLLTIWVFAALTGLAPATTRAALMFSLFIISHMMARRTDSLNLLAGAAIVMLAVDPMLLFNVGWQLSFSAVAGILLMRPAINLSHNILWQLAVVSLAATLATLPVSLATFHQVQPYFLIANIVIIPLAPLMLELALLYMAVPCGITAFVVKWPLWYGDWLTDGISRLPGSVITVAEPSSCTIALFSAATIFILITINIVLRRYNSKKDKRSC